MKIATTTGDFGFYLDNDEARIRELHRAGFRYIDLSMYSMTPDSVYMRDGWRDEVKRLREVADELGMKFVQAHSPGGNPLSEDRGRVEFLVSTVLRSIEICEMLGIKNTVLHNGVVPGICKEKWFEVNRAFYSRLIPKLEECGVNLLCENSTFVNTGGEYFLNSGKDMREFIDYVGHPLIHGCWDTGHGNCEGNQYDDIMALGEELYAIHYNDNRGEKDEHVAPFLGTLNHDEIINALIDVGFKGYFTLECDSSLRKYNTFTGNRKRFLAKDVEPRLREPQLFMQRHIEAMMYETAKWMLGEYGLFEE